MKRTPPDQYGWAGGCLGTFVGGAGSFIGLLILAIASNDPGGPFAWPIVTLGGAIVGLVVGGFIGLVLRHLKS